METDQSKFNIYCEKTRVNYILLILLFTFVLFALFRAMHNDKQSEYYKVAVQYARHTKEIVDVTGEVTSIGYFVAAETLESPYWVKLKVIGKKKTLEVQVFLLKKENGWVAESHKFIN